VADPTLPRVLTSLMGAEDLKTPERRKAYAGSLADEIVELVHATRKRLGLPRLPEKAP
jgi:hypothetical protein